MKHTAIASGSATALDDLRARIHELAEKQRIMKAFNEAVRRNDTGSMHALGFDDARIEKLLMPDYMGRRGFPPFELTNNAANLRRYQKRLDDLLEESDKYPF